MKNLLIALALVVTASSCTKQSMPEPASHEPTLTVNPFVNERRTGDTLVPPRNPWGRAPGPISRF